MVQSLTFHFFRFNITSQVGYFANLIGVVDTVPERVMMNAELLGEYVYNLSSFSFLIRSHLLLDLIVYRKPKQELEEQLTENRTIRNKSILQMMTYFEQHFAEQLLIDDLAVQFKFNPAYLSRLFKEEVGIPPKEYLNRIRLKHVQQLLISTNLSIQEIAEFTGYKNGFYLSKVFKERFSYSPSQFRKKHSI